MISKGITSFTGIFIILILFFFSPDITAFGKTKESLSLLYILNQKGKAIPIYCEIAATSQKRAKGLMNRKKLAKDRGMLFVFEKALRPSFWMRNTFIPLSIAFISKDMQIMEIYQMSPNSEKLYSSQYLVKYALEVNQGFFEKNHIREGDRVFFQK